MRTRSSIYSGYGASDRPLRVDSRIGRGRGREIRALRSLRATASPHSGGVAHVYRKRGDELCWLASRRLVEVAPLSWLARTSRKAIAAIMTGALLASCILFMAGQDAVNS